MFTYNSLITILGINPRETLTCTSGDTYKNVFIAALVTKANPNTHEQESEQINWTVHTMEYYTGFETSELQ